MPIDMDAESSSYFLDLLDFFDLLDFLDFLDLLLRVVYSGSPGDVDRYISAGAAALLKR